MTVFMPMTVSASMIANYPFDLRADFATVGQTAWSYNVLVTHPTVNARSVPELVALLKARPGKFSYASGSVGTPAHVIAELFKVQTGTFAIHVPYNQFGQAISDLVGGQHQFMFVAIPPVVQFIEQGRLRALAVTGPQRVQSLPQIATMAELGYKDLVVRDWQGFAVKSGTPRDIISRLNASVGVALSDGEVNLALAKLGVDPAGGPPEQFAELIGNELMRWAELVKRQGLKLP